MEAGKLRHRVTLKRPTETENDFGKPDKTYTTLGNARRAAAVTSRSGQESRIAQQMAATADYRVEMRADEITKTLLETDMIVWHGPTGDVDLGIGFVDDTLTHRGKLLVQCVKKRT